jgi:hypothetical protein
VWFKWKHAYYYHAIVAEPWVSKIGVSEAVQQSSRNEGGMEAEQVGNKGCRVAGMQAEHVADEVGKK